MKLFSPRSLEHLLFPLHKSAYLEIERQLQTINQCGFIAPVNLSTLVAGALSHARATDLSSSLNRHRALLVRTLDRLLAMGAPRERCLRTLSARLMPNSCSMSLHCEVASLRTSFQWT
jgi:hypothetical protein